MPQRNRARERRRDGARSASTGTEPGTTATRPPEGTVRIATVEAAQTLAAQLLDPERRWPVAVVSTPADSDGPLVDVDVLKAEVGDLAEVVLVPTGEESWAFSAQMPPRTQVYGGASRVYGVELDWVADPYRSRLRFAYTPADGARVLELLVHDVLAAALRAGLVGAAAPEPVAAARVGGVVAGVVGKRAVVDLDDGGQAVVAEEATVAGLPLAQVVRAGQHVVGTLDDASRLLDLGASLPDDGESRALVHRTYRVGDVVLARVRDAEPDAVTLELTPLLACRLSRHLVTGNELDHVDDLFSPGETVIARTVASPGGLGLRLDDIDDVVDRPVPALALLPGGPPWLAVGPPPVVAPPTAVEAALEAAISLPSVPVVEPDRQPTEPGPSRPTPALLAGRAHGDHSPLPRPVRPEPEPAPAVVVPSKRALQDSQLALAQARGRAERAEAEALDAGRRATGLAADNQQLLAEIEHLRAQVEKLENQLRDLKTKYRRADRRRQLAQREPTAPSDDGPWFTDPEQQLRHDVYDAWVRTVSAGEKADLPLVDYDVGPKFLDSLDRIEGVSRRKVAETVVHVVVGRAGSVNGLQLHALRTSDSGGAPARTRDDGATCYRASLQVNTHSARRLHFWKLPDGSVELSRVVVHDDMEP